ncbi:myb-like protein Q [Zophobas morio]|uniref:myb-like protein Q n=1 Tax=Zophobas morio TaxID=2755281 RepID=UPI003083D605
MKSLVIFPVILCIIQVYAADKQDVKSKTTSSPVNTIQQNPKYDMVYQTVKLQQPVQQLHQQIQLQPVQIQPLHQIPLQQRAHYIPIQILPKQYYAPQPQHAMIIIAQPALLPQSLVYGNPMQQLLNYFHNNPQARYQLLHGNYQQQAQQTQAQHTQLQAVQPTATYMHPVLASPVSNYFLSQSPQVTTQIATQPQLVAHTSPMPTPAVQYPTQPAQAQFQVQQVQQHHHQQQQQQQQQQQPQPQTSQLSSIAHLAQLAAQQYVSTQMKTAPAIVTGFEHFTPEQQAQIKAQLSTHLGSNFHAVAAGTNPQYSSKYVAEQDNNNFVPSPQVKNEPVTTISSQTAELLKSRYLNKAKN